MITHYLGEEQVDAYLRDLAKRLLALPQPPNVWCPIGRSGAILLRRLIGLAPALDANGKVVPVHHNRDADSVKLESDDARKDIDATHVCILDSSIHSGSTMLRAVRLVQGLKPATLTTYSLVLKRGSVLVPTFWGVTIDDHDRAYFLLDELPNNRLEARQVPQCHLRLLCEDDLALPRVVGGLESLDHITWGDRLYDMRCSSQERRTYVMEAGSTVVGYLTFSIRDHDNGSVLTIDEVVVSQDHQGAKHCSTMVRFAETMARQARCYEIRLWAIDNKIGMYQRLEFQKAPGVDVMNLGDEKYTLMEKKVIYHLRLPVP